MTRAYLPAPWLERWRKRAEISPSEWKRERCQIKVINDFSYIIAERYRMRSSWPQCRHIVSLSLNTYTNTCTQLIHIRSTRKVQVCPEISGHQVWLKLRRWTAALQTFPWLFRGARCYRMSMNRQLADWDVLMDVCLEYKRKSVPYGQALMTLLESYRSAWRHQGSWASDYILSTDKSFP